MKWQSYLCLSVSLIFIFGCVSIYGLVTPNTVPDELLEDDIDMEIVPGEFCYRTCTKHSKPLRCYFKLTAEDYVSLGSACDYQQPPIHYRKPVTNSTCVLLDGFERTLLTINRMFPAPPLQGCVGDLFIVDYRNNFQGGSSVIHFHGISQKYTPWSDGVPLVSQCPIYYPGQYRYWFLLDIPGTYFYHGHLGLTKLNGETGAIIVREPQENYVNGHLYDDDDHIIMVHDWLHTSPKERFVGRRFNDVGMEADNLLINGRGHYIFDNGTETNVPLAHFHIRRGYRTRFRFINSMATGCTVLLTIEKHRMLIIEKDGQPIEPFVCDSLASMTGERYDFVLEANETEDHYWIQIRGVEECLVDHLIQWAVLHYDERSLEMPSTPRPSRQEPLTVGVKLNSFNGCNDTHVCIAQLSGNYEDVNPNLYEENVTSFLLPFQLHTRDPREFHEANKFERFYVGVNLMPTVGSIANITFSLPSAPIISQIDDIDPNDICDSCNRTDGIPCYCSHVKKVPLDTTIEIIFVDARNVPLVMQHPMHLHGYFCNLIGYGLLADLNITNYTNEAFLAADKAGLVKRNLDPNKRPIRVDTVVVPQNGYIILRFFTDNPGYWFSHCHILTHMATGMEMVFQVGEREDMMPNPKDLPKCGIYEPSNLMLSQILSYHDESSC